ncbi:MAG: NifU family protein [Bacteroidetes bacterium]|nr:NifU family protein [Bacteroidota bacterium]
MMNLQTISVFVEGTPNPDSLKFVLNKMILPNDSADFRSKSDASNSPLALALFAYSDVDGIFIMNNFVSVTKKPSADWQELAPVIKEAVKNLVESGIEIVSQSHSLSDEEESEVVMKIKQLLDDHVKPAVEMDGGAISFKSFHDGVVTVVMKGSCSGCPSSTFTLKAGIESLLKRMVPEVRAVEAEI